MENNKEYVKRYYLVEDHDPLLDHTDGTVVALTPEACYGLRKAGASYKIIEDFYNVSDLKSSEDKYFYEQLEWFKEMDRLLKDNIEYCKKADINLARAHFYQLKYFMDSIILQSLVFNEFIGRASPCEIIYIRSRRDAESGYSLYDLYNNKRNFVFRLARLICGKNGIPFSLKECGEINKATPPKMAFSLTIKRFLKLLNAKSAYYFFKYAKAKKFLSAKAQQSLNLLVLHAGCLSIDMVVNDAIGAKGNIYFKDGNKIVLISRLIHKDVLDLSAYDKDEGSDAAGECRRAFNCFVQDKSLLGWINSKCGIDVTEILIPYFKGFVENICMNNILEIPRLEELFRKEKIDFVIARSSSEKDAISAFLAATNLRMRVCFQHGVAFSTKTLALTELDLADQYFVMDGISDKYFKNCLRLDYVSECAIFEASHYLNAIRKRWHRVNGPDNTIMYVPTRLFTGLNAYNENFYSLPWYFEFQRSVIDYFGSMKDLNFIYKCTIDQEWLDGSVLLYLKDKNYPNIHVEKIPLNQCLGKAGRIIFDYPSTGFYEAAASKKPIMSLFHRAFKMDKEIRSYFGKSIQDFSDISEAVRKIADFIHSDSKHFLIDIPLSGNDSLSVLRKIKSSRGKSYVTG